MTIDDLSKAVRASKEAGHSKLAVPLFLLDRLIEQANRSGQPMSLEDEARQFMNRPRDVIRVPA